MYLCFMIRLQGECKSVRADSVDGTERMSGESKTLGTIDNSRSQHFWLFMC